MLCVKPYLKESEILKLSPSTKIATAEGWQIYHHKKKHKKQSQLLWMEMTLDIMTKHMIFC